MYIIILISFQDLINDTPPLPYDLPAEPPPLPSEPEFTELAEEPPPPPPPLPPADGEEDEEEMALRAQLLQSMVQKRNAVPSGPIEVDVHAINVLRCGIKVH